MFIYSHGATCGKDSNHRELETQEINYKNVLICPDCGWFQLVDGKNAVIKKVNSCKTCLYFNPENNMCELLISKQRETAANNVCDCFKAIRIPSSLAPF